MSQAVILAGGLGTRLRGVLADLPKPMAPVCGKPFLEYQLAALHRFGFEDVVICVGYRGSVISEYFGDGSQWALRIIYSAETTPLGTAGALKHASSMFEEHVLVLNGDTFLDFDYRGLVEFHHEKDADATIAVVSAGAPELPGNVSLRADGLVDYFADGKMHDAGVQRDWRNAGVYVLERAWIDRIPSGRSVSLEQETFPLSLTEAVRLFGKVVSGYFVDIGTPEDYFRFERDVAEGRIDAFQK